MLPVLLLDGGFSNELSKRCFYDVDKDPLWTAKALLTDQDAVTDTHLAYLNAGADIIETATYQATVQGLQQNLHLKEADCEVLIANSVTLARKAVQIFGEANEGNKAAEIAGSIGPYGVYLHDGSEYTGSYMDNVTDQQIIDIHSKRIDILLRENVTLLALETMPSSKEVEILLNWLSSKNLGPVQVWVSFVLDTADPTKTVRGDLIVDAFKMVSKYPFVWGFGTNCVNPTSVSPFLQTVSAVKKEIGSQIRLMVYPNVGRKWESGKGWSDKDVPPISEYVNEWMELGANVIGGCCQVGADDIKSLRQIITDWNSNK